MNHVMAVRRRQPLGDCGRQLDDTRRSEARCYLVGQRLSVDQFHGQEVHAGFLVQPVDGGNVRVVERREQFGFALEPREPLRIVRKCLGQDLDRDLAIERRVDRFPDNAHAARAEAFDEAVVKEHGAGLDRQGRHREVGDIKARSGMRGGPDIRRLAQPNEANAGCTATPTTRSPSTE